MAFNSCDVCQLQMKLRGKHLKTHWRQIPTVQHIVNSLGALAVLAALSGHIATAAQADVVVEVLAVLAHVVDA